VSVDDSAPLGVLFDVEGTLVDSPYLHPVCWAEALRQSGHDIPMATVHRAIGMGSDELLHHLLGEDETNDDAVIDIAHLTLYKQCWGRLRPLPGAADLIRGCAANGLQVVLASSASKGELVALRSALDADDAIHAATGSADADADAGKPAQDILQAALDQARLAPERSVFVGDAVWDGQTAARAGVRFIGVACGGTSEAELRENGSAEVGRDPADLSDHIEHSVLPVIIGSQ
jgi:HAD superfamily hydrolase (TIGR01509 family)